MELTCVGQTDAENNYTTVSSNFAEIKKFV